MKKGKIIINYFLELLLSLMFVFLGLLLILKFTIYNHNYINKLLKDNDYVDLVYEEIKIEMNNYIMSTGFNDDVLNDLFTKEEVEKDINLFINNVLNGQKTKLKKDNIKEKLDNNINSFLKKSNLKLLNEKEINSFENDIVDVYINEITLYKMADGYISKYNIGNKYLKVALVVNIILILLICLCLRKNKNNHYGSCFITAGLIILFIRLAVYERIDMKNILIITENFSRLIRDLLVYNNKMLLYSSIIFLVLGIWFVYVKSYVIKKKSN